MNLVRLSGRTLLLLIVALWIALPALAAGQAGGRVSGRVTGPGGGPLPGARVVLTNTGAGSTRTATTDAAGAYAFEGLTPATYRIDVTYTGMDPVVRDRLAVSATAAVTIDVSLMVTATKETVDVVGRLDRDTQFAVTEDTAALKTGLPILLTPQAVQVVPRAVLRDQNALTLTDAVRNVAGVASDFGFNGSTQPLIILRGFQAQSMTAMSQMSGGSSYYLNGTKVQGVPINMANVQSVEVVKGPATVLYGRSEPGGLVNVVSRPIPNERAFGVEQTVAQFGGTRTGADAAGPLNASKTLFGRVGGSWFINQTNRDFVRDHLGALTASISWVPDTATRVTATLDYTNQSYRNDFGIPALGDRPADLPRTRQFNNAPEPSTVHTTSLLVDAQRRLSSHWTLNGRALVLRSNTHEVDIWPYRVDLFTGVDCLAATNELCRYYYYDRPEGQGRTHQVGVDLRGDLQTGRLQHSVLVGVETFGNSKTGTTYLQQISSVNINNPVFTATTPLDTTLAAPFEYDDHNRWTSVFAQDVVALGHGLRVMGAVRFDSTSAIFAEPGTAPNEQSFVTPRVGLVWQPAANHSIYGQYQDAVDANNGRDPATGKELDAERSRQVEVGYKVSALHGGLNLTIAGYQLTKRNRADYSLFPTVQTVGEARSRGLEVDLLGQVSSQLAMMASYALTDALVTSDPLYQGTTLANVPRHAGSLWLRYMFTERWAAGGGVFFQGLRQGDIGNTFQLPGYGRADAMLSYAFRAGAWRNALQLNVNNVFDTLYYSGSHQFVKDWIQLGAPRTVSLSVRLDR